MPRLAAPPTLVAFCVLALAGLPSSPPSVQSPGAREQVSLARELAREKKLDEARAAYQAAAAAARRQGDLALVASILTSLAALSDTPPAESVALSRQAWDIARQLGDPDLEARALHFWGDYLFTAGDYAAAMEKLQEAAALTERRKDGEALARIYTSLGRLNRMHGQAEAAIALYRKALEIQEKAGDLTGTIQSLNATGVALQSLERYREGNDYYERAYALALQSKDQEVIDFMRGNLAGGLLNTGDYARAAGLLEQVIAAGAGVYAGVRHGQLARAYLEIGRLDDALAHADRAVELTASQPTQLPNALVGRASVRERRGELDAGIADANAAIAHIESMRLRLVPADFMKQRYSGYYQLAYTRLIALYLRAGQPDKALETAELGRSRAFLDLLAARDPAPGAERRQAEAGRPPGIDEVRAAARRADSTIVSYWASDEGLFVWVVPPDGAVTMTRVAATRRELASLVDAATSHEAALDAAAPVTRGPGGRARRAGRRNAWSDLYQLLIAPVAARLPRPGARITIVPDGPLQRLSFAALRGTGGRYLVEDYAISYTPAVALLGLTAGHRSDPASRSYLFVADPDLAPVGGGASALAPLPGARVEVRRLSALVPAARSTTLSGPKADKDRVVRELGSRSVVHFATHGITRDDDPLESYLALGAGAAPGGTGRLTARELYELRLQADLVVLASCQSAGGKPSGDGLSALARAFFFAGARSVVASLWDVPDDTASRFMPLFYASWLGGTDRVQALRRAQLRLLADLRSGRVTVKTPAGAFVLPEDPSLWAGFVLLGQ